MKKIMMVCINNAFRFFLVCATSVWCAVTASALEAEFVTSRGTFIVDLLPETAPLAVTHFVDLAEGRKTWVDPATGSVRAGAFYNGKAVARAAATSSERYFQIGGFTQPDADPGYGFPDEIHPGANQQPYIMAMAPDGPNTNGSRVELTGSVSMQHRNGRNTVIGKIRVGQGRNVVDSIITAGANATTIHSLNIRGKDAVEPVLEESRTKLPVVSGVNGALSVIPGISSDLVFTQPANSVLTAWSSTDLNGWRPHYRRFIDGTGTSPEFTANLDNAAQPSRFYHLAVVYYPDLPKPVGMSSLAGRLITIEGPDIATISYQFDQTGRSGHFENTLAPGMPPFFSGNFSVDDDFPVKANPYSLRILLNTPGFGGSPKQLVKIGWDTGAVSSVSGRHETIVMDSSMNVIFTDYGSVTAIRTGGGQN